MGRFNNTGVAPDVPQNARPVAGPLQPLRPTESDPSLLQRVGFAVLCIFSISGYLNEFAVRLFHVKAYISTVSWALLPVLLLLSGNMFRGFRDVTGRLWALFLAWILLATPFSVWRGGSVAMLLDYVPHGWIQFYYFTTFVLSTKHLRRLMFFLIASNFLLLVDCAWAGLMQTGRLEIPDSMFFRNSNDLSLQLLVAITQFAYLLFERGMWKRITGAAAMLTAVVFLFKTGARGASVALVALTLASLLMSRHRIRFALFAAAVSCGAVLIAPASVFHRISLIALEPESIVATDVSDEQAVGSQIQRMALLRQSVIYALTNPLVGVGPGQFAAAAARDLAEEGKQAPWVGTHNSYTQVASECGIPAFLLYSSVIFLALCSNLRVYRHASPSDDAAGALAFCLFGSALAYATCTLFFHLAYSSYLPAIAGMSVALRLANRRLA